MTGPGIIRTSEGDQKFDHLLVTPQEEGGRETGSVPDSKKTRYMTTTRQTQALTLRESVSNLHERVSGIRLTAHLYAIGVDKTQSIALDEIFGKKIVDVNGVERSTKVFRKTRVTQVPIKEEDEDEREGTNASV